MMERIRFRLEGAVQGVGFRPFVYRVARNLGIAGSIANDTRGVVIEAEGETERLDRFRRALREEFPPLAYVSRFTETEIPAGGDRDFVIAASEASGGKTATLLPDVATCGDCLREVFDPGNRRHLYPFTNCTNCGPRYSIIESLPYDRRNTSMKSFVLCDACRKEHDDPADRRFHAQPNACVDCGPTLALLERDGRRTAGGHDALLETVRRIGSGMIAAVKGLGGYHLVADARRGDTIARLREGKNREEKPFALLFPGLVEARAECDIEPGEEELLAGREAPIVLLRRRPGPGAHGIAEEVAPGNPFLGIMLPSTALHHILMRELGFPVVATSGNVSDEPIAIDEEEASRRLAGIADFFLAHDRPIVRRVDDSIVRFAAGRGMMLRRSRGYAPLPVQLESRMPPLVAVGAHLKNTVATAVERSVFVSQHIGDLETAEAHRAFEQTLEHLEGLHDLEPAAVACDLHPDYLSTRFARASGRRVIPVQHHLAHVLACTAENRLDGPVLGVSWDGTGYGTDGTVWGGEFLAVDGAGWRRVAHLRPFPLPGGERAVREPRRSALGIFFAMEGADRLRREGAPPGSRFTPEELDVLLRATERRVNAPPTTSAGRLFDAVASLSGIRQISTYEGQAAMELEHAAHRAAGRAAPTLEMPLRDGDESTILDWEPAIRSIVEALREGADLPAVALAFHKSLVCAIVKVAHRWGGRRVALTGGCFQNRILLESAVDALRDEGFEVIWHRVVPPNDGGISLGQIAWAARLLREER